MSLYQKVGEGEALVVNRMSDGPEVIFEGGAWVLPIVHVAEVMDLTPKAVAIERRGDRAIVSSDSVTIELELTFRVRVNATEDDVLRVARDIGCAHVKYQSVVEELLADELDQALVEVVGAMESTEMMRDRRGFIDALIAEVGEDLNGFVLDDVTIETMRRKR